MYCAVPMRHACAPSSTPQGRGPARRAAALAVLLGVVAGHALVLVALPAGVGGGGDAGVHASALPTKLRTVLALPAPPPTLPLQALAPPAVVRALAVDAPPPEPLPLPLPLPLPVAEPVAVAVHDAASVALAASTAAAASAAAAEVVEPAAEPASAPASDAGGELVPVYATRLPPAARLRYVLRRGLLGGSGELAWAPQADGGYRLALEGSAFGQTLLAQHSRGHVDAHGLAPERFTDRRRGRTEMAANFQREAGKLTYSGPTVEYPLPPGAQDRVSWLVQLGAVLAADPALQAEGAAVQLFVTGARGDADVWTFVVQGRAALALPGGTVPDALHVLRAPRRAFDTQAEAWLDPARGFLPVRVRLATPDSGDVTELLLGRD